MQQTTLKAMDSFIEFEKSSDLWDMPPVLMVVTEAKTWMFPLMMGGMDQYEALATVAAGLAFGGLPVPIDRKDVTGLIYRVEAWTLQDKAGMPEYDALKGMGLQISDHPERIEAKTFYAVDADGFGGKILYRDHPEMDDQPGSMEGRLADHLRNIFTAVTTWEIGS